MNDRLEHAGCHFGWEVWALVRQRLETRSARGGHAVTATREPVAILLQREGRLRVFALSPDLADPDRLADRIRAAR